MITKDKIESTYDRDYFSDDSFCFVDIYSKQLKNKPMNFKTAYNKIIAAYFKDEIKPFDPHFCFCGTLCNNTTSWFYKACEHHYGSHGYKGKDFVRMEKCLFKHLTINGGRFKYMKGTKEYEDAIFEGMSEALEVLKSIHREKGENVDEEIEFKKRNLSSVLSV